MSIPTRILVPIDLSSPGETKLPVVEGYARTFGAEVILLHVMPGDPGFGSALFGYHYYTWAFLGFAIAILLIAAMLLFDRQFAPDVDASPHHAGAFGHIAVWLVIALTALNVIATFMECGFGACPDNPVEYELLKSNM